jgi:hypothetical protein
MQKKRRKQLMFHDWPSGFHGARIFQDNRWVKLSKIIPWDLVEAKYSKAFTRKQTGNPSIESRMAFGALIIKQDLNLSDEATVEMIRENPHCQYFIGLSEFTDVAPFDSSKMVAFRKRFTPEAMAEINEAIIKASQDEPPSNPPVSGDDNQDASTEEKPDNKGTLLLDATCAPANIHYPTDAGVLHKARELSEQLIDQLWQPAPGKRKPRTYRQQARQNYLRLSRNKRPGYRLIRKTIRKQLSYLLRNLGSLEVLSQTTPLTAKQRQQLKVLKTIYEQQRDMYDKRQHKTEKRIVSVHQPWVRPIVRGKQTADTEFGAKIAISVENGYSRVEKFSFEAFNESQTLQASCERYKKRHGHYPERVLADKIYRNRKNLDYCKERGIHLNGPKLGRPPKDKKLYELQKQLEKKEAGERNMVEAKFGEAKLCYGLDRVMAMRQDTSETCVQLIFLVMNLKKRLRSLFDLLFSSIQLSRFYLSVRLVNVGQ